MWQVKALAKGVTLQQHVGGRSICSSSSSVKISKCEIDCCKVSLLLYFCCTRGHVTSRCQSLFPPNPFFKGKAPETWLRDYREFPGSRRKPFYSQEFPRSFSLFLFQYSHENSQECWRELTQIKFYGNSWEWFLGNSGEIPGNPTIFLRNFAWKTGKYRSYFGAFVRKKLLLDGGEPS